MENHGYDFIYELDRKDLLLLLNYIIGNKSISPKELEQLYLGMIKCLKNIEEKKFVVRRVYGKK